MFLGLCMEIKKQFIKMKNQNISYVLLLICALITIVGGKVSLPFNIRLINLLTLAGLSSFYFISVLRIMSILETKTNIYEMVSGIIFIFSTAFLAIFQFVKIPGILTVIQISVIVNGIYCYYLFYRKYDRNLPIKHLVFSILLMGAGILSNV